MKLKLLKDKNNKLYLPVRRTQTGLPAPRSARAEHADRPNIFYVYAIACESGSYYIGHTDDLRWRWAEHLSGIGANWTKRHRPICIAHYEEYDTREEAIAREQELKTGFGRKWLIREIKAGWARQAGGLTEEEIEIVEGG